MGAASDAYTKAVSLAEKTLSKAGAPGKPAVPPKPRLDPEQAIVEASKAFAAAVKAMDEFTKLSDDLEAANAKLKQAAKQYAGVIKDDDFNLGDKDPKNKKIIADVQKIMLDALKGLEDLAGESDDLLDDIDKAVVKATQGFGRLKG